MNGLMLESPTSGPCSREIAFNSTLIPEATNTYQPLSNQVMLDIIYRIAGENSITLSNEQLGMDLKGQRFFGVCDIESNDFFHGSIKMMIGFCNSYNGTMAARFCLGGKVFVCSNLAFHAYTDDKTGISGISIRPHKNLNSLGIYEGLAIQIKEAFIQIENFRQSQESFYGSLLDYELSNERAYATIVRAAQQGFINKTSVLTLANEWDYQAVEPEDIDKNEWHEEFQDRTAYSLFNAFTQVNKQRLVVNPVQANLSTMDLTHFFYREFQL